MESQKIGIDSLLPENPSSGKATGSEGSPKLVLYTCTDSPPGRAVQIVLKHLGVPYSIKTVDFDSGEHFSEEFLKVIICLFKK